MFKARCHTVFGHMECLVWEFILPNSLLFFLNEGIWWSPKCWSHMCTLSCVLCFYRSQTLRGKWHTLVSGLDLCRCYNPGPIAHPAQCVLLRTKQIACVCFSFGCLFWYLFVFVVFCCLCFNNNNNKKTLESTNARNILFVIFNLKNLKMHT